MVLVLELLLCPHPALPFAPLGPSCSCTLIRDELELAGVGSPSFQTSFIITDYPAGAPVQSYLIT